MTKPTTHPKLSNIKANVNREKRDSKDWNFPPSGKEKKKREDWCSLPLCTNPTMFKERNCKGIKCPR